jgi:predicted aldo/keto reductase-like oxidoreductase
MRFEHIDDRGAAVEMMLRAAEGGVNYFDTAPQYFGTKSEEVFGEGLSVLRREVDGQLRRLGVEHIDFYHAWCITKLEDWRSRRDAGVIGALRRLREEGIIGHICVSSHLVGDEIVELLEEGVLEGVLFSHRDIAVALEAVEREADASFEGLCTGCQYCDHCPEGIPVPKLMEAYNYRMLYGEETKVLKRLRLHWDVDPRVAARCIACGECEDACTQHLPIIERLSDIERMAR